MSEQADQLTLVASLHRLPPTPASPPDEYVVREARETDLEGLAALYFAAYPRNIVASEGEALQEIKATFEGE